MSQLFCNSDALRICVLVLCIFSKSSAFYLLSPSVHPVVWSSPCIHISCLDYIIFYSVSLTCISCTIYIPVFPVFSARSLCPWHTFQRYPAWSPSLTGFVYPYFWFRILFFVLFWPTAIGPVSVFQPLMTDYPSALLLWLDWSLVSIHCVWLWIVFITTVCWNYNPVHELSHCYWITCTTCICTCNTRFCLTLLKVNKDSLFIVVLVFGSSPVSLDRCKEMV